MSLTILYNQAPVAQNAHYLSPYFSMTKQNNVSTVESHSSPGQVETQSSRTSIKHSSSDTNLASYSDNNDRKSK